MKVKNLSTTAEVVNIIENQGAILFTAPDCARCVAVLALLEAKNITNFSVLHIDQSDMYPVKAFNITSAPVMIAFKQGKELSRLSGYHGVPAYRRLLESPDMRFEELEDLKDDIIGAIIPVVLEDMAINGDDEVISKAEITQTMVDASATFHRAIGEAEAVIKPQHEEAYGVYINKLTDWIYNLANGK